MKVAPAPSDAVTPATLVDADSEAASLGRLGRGASVGPACCERTTLLPPSFLSEPEELLDERDLRRPSPSLSASSFTLSAYLISVSFAVVAAAAVAAAAAAAAAFDGPAVV